MNYSTVEVPYCNHDKKKSYFIFSKHPYYMLATYHIKFVNSIFPDIDEYYYACSQCSWSDRTKYTERKVKKWPDGEPSKPKVLLNVSLVAKAS